MFNTTTYLSVIVPAFNESETIHHTLSYLRSYLREQPWDWEVIVVADGTDGTRERAVEFADGDPHFEVIGSTQRRGKGRGVREGVLRASGQVIGFLDADYKTPIEDVERILPWLDAGYDVVIGSRRAADAEIQTERPLFRRVGSRVFGLLMHGLMDLPPVRDTQCGFKFFTRAAARTLFTLQRVDGYMFDVEVLRLSKMMNFNLKEVGVRWRDSGDSRYDPVGGTVKNFKELLNIRKMHYQLPVKPAALQPVATPARLAA